MPGGLTSIRHSGSVNQSAPSPIRHNIDAWGADTSRNSPGNEPSDAYPRRICTMRMQLMTEISVPDSLPHQGFKNLGTHMDQLLMITGFKIDFRLFRDGIIHQRFHAVRRANRR